MSQAADDKADGPSVTRLRAALFQSERRLAELQAREKKDDAVIDALQTCLKRAERDLSRGAYYLAWDCIHQFDDELLRGMTQEERKVHWTLLCAEAKEKLKGSWRGDAADSIIKRVPAGEAPPLEVARALQRQLAAAAQNKQHKIDVFERDTLPTLTAALAGVVVAALAYGAVLLRGSEDKLALALVLGIAAGGLGGILSMAFSLGRTDVSGKIPEMRLGRQMTSLRPLLGAAVAIPVSLAAHYGYVSIKGLDGYGAVFAFCLLAGFSERWFLGIMSKFESEKAELGKKK